MCDLTCWCGHPIVMHMFIGCTECMCDGVSPELELDEGDTFTVILKKDETLRIPTEFMGKVEVAYTTFGPFISCTIRALCPVKLFPDDFRYGPDEQAFDEYKGNLKDYLEYKSKLVGEGPHE